MLKECVLKLYKSSLKRKAKGARSQALQIIFEMQKPKEQPKNSSKENMFLRLQIVFFSF
jgi:hypothetical protein